jgi:hypothetical protein
VGRQYGSEGKGNIAGHIAPEYDLLLGAGAGGHVEAPRRPCCMDRNIIRRMAARHAGLA